jgi:uncharacterized protein YjbI with pentapeptide repeats
MNLLNTSGTLIHCDPNVTNIRDLVLSAIRADKSLHRADLSGANLSSADLSSADLRGANLSSANLIGADLRSANLFSANLRSADLRSANLRYADLIGADLRYANLSGANLRYADLSGANLISANLGSADLRGANLSSANLSSANLRGAYLSSADLSFADLRYADLSQTCLDPANPVPVFEIGSFAFREDGDYVVGWRTWKSQHCGKQQYNVSTVPYETDLFSTDSETDCHPGLYLAPLSWLQVNYGSVDKIVQVRALKTEMIRAGNKFRAKRLWVLTPPLTWEEAAKIVVDTSSPTV